MKQAEGLIKDVNSLLIPCGGLSLNEVEQIGRKSFSDIFLNDTRRGGCIAHDGSIVVFFNDVFDHAFYKSPEKTILEIERVERIRWILPFIQGQIPNSECWEKVDSGVNKRIYISFGLGYVVWLKERLNGGWKFLTAYPAFRGQIRKYISGASRVSVFK